MRPSYVFEVLIADKALLTHHEQHSAIKFYNFAGGIITDVAQTDLTQALFPATQIQMVDPPMRSPRQYRNTDNDYWWCRYLFTADDESGV
ncbi:MAG: hypothetical protein ACYSTY_12245 [Planctomycetota bacterium]